MFHYGNVNTCSGEKSELGLRVPNLPASAGFSTLPVGFSPLTTGGATVPTRLHFMASQAAHAAGPVDAAVRAALRS